MNNNSYRAFAVSIPPLRGEIKVNFPRFNLGKELISPKKLISPDLIWKKLISSNLSKFVKFVKITNFTNFADLQGKRPAAGEKKMGFKVPKCGFYKVKWPAAGEKNWGFEVPKCDFTR